MSDCRFGVSPVNYPDPDPDRSTIYDETEFLVYVANFFYYYFSIILFLIASKTDVLIMFVSTHPILISL